MGHYPQHQRNIFSNAISWVLWRMCHEILNPKFYRNLSDFPKNLCYRRRVRLFDFTVEYFHEIETIHMIWMVNKNPDGIDSRKIRPINKIILLTLSLEEMCNGSRAPIFKDAVQQKCTINLSISTVQYVGPSRPSGWGSFATENTVTGQKRNNTHHLSTLGTVLRRLCRSNIKTHGDSPLTGSFLNQFCTFSFKR